MSEQKYTIDQIRTYILSQDSLGDILYNLTDENLSPPNDSYDVSEDEEKFRIWKREYGSNEENGYVDWPEFRDHYLWCDNCND